MRALQLETDTRRVFLDLANKRSGIGSDRYDRNTSGQKVQMCSRLTIPALALCLTACGGAVLDYETAINLLRERAADPVRTSISASPRFENQDPKVVQAYQRLIDAHVIQCKTTSVGAICEPGPAGDTLTQNGVTDLSVVAGRWMPAAIVAIQRTGASSASADVRMTFEPSTLFQEFEDAFDSIESAGSMPASTTRKQGKMVHVTFERYDDGWHVENIE
jgi:hypothetical protein